MSNLTNTGIKGIIRPGAIRVVCCACGALIKDGPTVDGHCSHGICEQCLPKALAEASQAVVSYGR